MKCSGLAVAVAVEETEGVERVRGSRTRETRDWDGEEEGEGGHVDETSPQEGHCTKAVAVGARKLWHEEQRVCGMAGVAVWGEGVLDVRNAKVGKV